MIDGAAHPRPATVWLVLLLSAIVLVPRAVLVARAHSSFWDDQFHLVRGLAFLRGQKHLDLLYNDPPLGEAILALPMWAMGCRTWHAPSHLEPSTLTGDIDNVLLGQRYSPDTILLVTALWKVLLLLPALAVMFLWCYELYGAGAGWLAVGLLIFDPTVTANIVPAAPDQLGMEAALIACWLGWRYFERPSAARMVLAGIACAGAMLMKHTCLVIPLIFAIYAAVARPSSQHAADLSPHSGAGRSASTRRRLNQFAAVMLITIAALWALTFFDFSRPRQYTVLVGGTYTAHWGLVSDVINPLLERRWPGGIYIGSLFQALAHGREGHPAMLLGKISDTGWWYYLPVLATYKIPIAYAIVMLLAACSLIWRPPIRREWSLVIPAVLLLAFAMGSRLSIGFRHALPAYIFILMLASRAATRMVPGIIATIALIAASIHTLAFHPDYLPYINWPRRDVFRQISDSNLDWDGGLKQVRRWLDEHPSNKPTYVAPFADPYSKLPLYYLGANVTLLWPGEPPPKSGRLIISPVRLAGAYDSGRPYEFLWNRKPIAIIGHTMRVYDLDAAPTVAQSKPQ